MVSSVKGGRKIQQKKNRNVVIVQLKELLRNTAEPGRLYGSVLITLHQNREKMSISL